MYFVMKKKSENVGGFELIGKCNTGVEAERIAKGHDGTLNGKPMGLTVIWEKSEYDAWHDSEIMPYYRD